MIGRILWGINNIYSVLPENQFQASPGATWAALECRFKGKVLQTGGKDYNPLAPGDRVEYQITGEGQGWILERLERSNSFARWNKKRQCPQTLAANITGILVLASPYEPPFRPRFLDRALILAEKGETPLTIILNKSDQGSDEEIDERLADFAQKGVSLLRVSALDGTGLDQLLEYCQGGLWALMGQSGVGKSSLLNRLVPGASLQVGEISRKHNRGSHTTNYGVLLPLGQGGGFIDTPGIREIELFGIPSAEVDQYFTEFHEFGLECAYQPCSHRHEPQCGVIRALEKDLILVDRYESYLRIREELENLETRNSGAVQGLS